jgi:hypothetical protein
MGDERTDHAEIVTNLQPDCYAILGVGPNADETAIHEAFETLSQQYHPDHFAGPKDEADLKLSTLVSAYAILSDPVRRRRYDLRRRIDALIALRTASEPPRREVPRPAVAARSKMGPRLRRYQAVLSAAVGGFIVVAIATAYQFSGRSMAEPRGSKLAPPPMAADARPSANTQPTTADAETVPQPSDADSGQVAAPPALPPPAATIPAEPRRVPQKPAVAKNPPADRAGNRLPAEVASESCSDVAAVLGLCKRRSTVKDK